MKWSGERRNNKPKRSSPRMALCIVLTTIDYDFNFVNTLSIVRAVDIIHREHLSTERLSAERLSAEFRRRIWLSSAATNCASLCTA